MSYLVDYFRILFFWLLNSITCYQTWSTTLVVQPKKRYFLVVQYTNSTYKGLDILTPFMGSIEFEKK